jgi:hypothetical protein
MTHPLQRSDTELLSYVRQVWIGLKLHERECPDEDCCPQLERAWQVWRECTAELGSRRKH